MQPISTTPLTPSQSNVAPPSLSENAQADEREKAERIARYSSREFTRQLLDHMRAAVETAVLEAQEKRET